MNCPDCGVYFKNLTQMRRHAHCHVRDGGRTCTFVAHNKAEMRRHIKEKHPLSA